MIAFLWAQDQTGLIGANDRLPWHLPDDLAYFKQQTLGQLTVFGRRTYLGLPRKPLPGRTNVVLSRDLTFAAPGATVVHSQAELLALAAAHPDQELIIAGGAQVFAALQDLPDTLLVTRLAGTFKGDTYMVPLDWARYRLEQTRQVSHPDPTLTHTFEVWRRK